MRVSASIQFYSVYRRWYYEGKKRVPRDLKLTPDVLLHWIVGDGGHVGGDLAIATQCFSEEENEFLASLIEQARGNRLQCLQLHSKSKRVYELRIKKVHASKFYEYLMMSRSETLTVAMDVFPWKFDAKFRKKDLMKSLRFD